MLAISENTTTMTIADDLLDMQAQDLRLRKQLITAGTLFEGYHPEMEALHIRNARRLEEILDTIGWPTAGKVGQEANEAAFLIVQHAISLPDFQRKCLQLMGAAVEQGLETAKPYAYLYDRIRCNEGRPQRFGTQFDWDENGEMSPCTIEDPEGVNARRQACGLVPIEAATAAMRQQVIAEGGTPPADLGKRQQEIQSWRRRTGWIK